MNTKTKAIAIVAAMAMVVSSCAQPKKGMVKGDSKKKESYAQLVVATTQTTMPGRPETPPITDYKFIIVWTNNTPPSSFFWRGEAGWLPCSVSTVKGYDASKLTSMQNIYTPGYEATEISLEKIKKNDTLELSPISGGKYPIPESIPSTTKNTIFYKAGNSNWLTLPVKKFVERPDIIMQ